MLGLNFRKVIEVLYILIVGGITWVNLVRPASMPNLIRCHIARELSISSNVRNFLKFRK
jgi:hypothetical protein